MKFTSEDLVSFAENIRFDDLPDDVVDTALDRILDTIGVSIASSSQEEITELIALFGADSSNRQASVFGNHQETSVEYAALLNSAMARWLDFNDTYSNQHTGTHPSDIIPALLSVAEVTQASGQAVIEAIVIGYEIQCRGLDTGIFWNNGFDYAAWGAYATALGAGKLFELSTNELRDALGIAANSNNGLRVVRSGEISMWKGLSQPYAIHNAIQAVQMAARGITGPKKVFEGVPGGVLDSIATGPVLLDGPGEDGKWRITETAIKPYCCGYGAVPAVEATTRIMTNQNLTVTDVEAVEVRVVNRLLETYGSSEKWGPDLTRETADHSLPYCVAIALQAGTVYPEHYGDNWLKADTVYELMDRISVTGSDELTTYEHDHPRELPTEVSITGPHKTHTERVSTPSGHPYNPFSHTELHEKFTAVTDTELTPSTQNAIIAECESLSMQESVEPLLKHS